MRHHITSYLDNAITLLLMLVAGATPLLFLNQTTEFFETPKLIFLIVTTIILVGLWIASWIFKGKVAITRTPLDIPLLAFLVVIFVSTYFSATKYAAIFGNLPTVHGSAVAWTTYILLYFVAASNFKSLAKIKTFLYVLYASATAVALVTLLSFFHAFLPISFAQAANFTPTGSSFSTIALLLLLLPLPLVSLVHSNKFMPVPLALTLSILFVITISFIGSVPSYVALFIAFALCIVVARADRSKKTGTLLLVPMLIGVVILVFSYAFPNPVKSLSDSFPREIQLPFSTSWKVSASAFRDDPFKGTGPSSYVFNFSTYKPLEFNLLKFWNFSFESAYNEYLQVLGTLGIFGFSALVLISLIILRTSWKNLSAHSSDESGNSTVMLPALAVSGILSVVLLAIHATTLVSVVVTLFIFAALMMSQKEIREKVMELALGIRATTSDNKQFDLFPVILFVLFLIGVIPAFIKLGSIVSADYYHRQALAQASKSGTLTYQYLQKAESLNPQVDLYRVDMAQTNFALANALAAQKGPSQSNPKGSLTDQDKRTIQTLLSQSINEGRAAVLLNPRSARNWSVLASIYRNISGVANNALAFSLDAYGRAIQRDPLNPVLRLNVGGIYYTAKNYDQSVRFFSDAINLKPDYANAYYNLTIALRDKGDLANAKTVAQQTVVVLQNQKATETPDYKVAQALLKDIDAKISAQAAAQAAQTAPAAQTDSALGKENVPGVDVSSLKTPPQTVVTPAPVKANPNAKIPQPTPTPKKAATQ